MSYLVCPECTSDKVVIYEVRAVMVNTYEYYCHSVKAHDSNAEVRCLACGFEGEVKYLKEVE